MFHADRDLLRNVANAFDPEGRATIAQRFIAGAKGQRIPFRPGGTTENGGQITPSIVPPGLETRSPLHLPGSELPGYYRMSLRDKNIIDILSYIAYETL